jgi:hypothetical protein
MARTYVFTQKDYDILNQVDIYKWQVIDNGVPQDMWVGIPNDLHPDVHFANEHAVNDAIKAKFIALGFTEEQASILSGH